MKSTLRSAGAAGPRGRPGLPQTPDPTAIRGGKGRRRRVCAAAGAHGTRRRNIPKLPGQRGPYLEAQCGHKSAPQNALIKRGAQRATDDIHSRPSAHAPSLAKGRVEPRDAGQDRVSSPDEYKSTSRCTRRNRSDSTVRYLGPQGRCRRPRRQARRRRGVRPRAARGPAHAERKRHRPEAIRGDRSLAFRGGHRPGWGGRSRDAAQRRWNYAAFTPT